MEDTDSEDIERDFNKYSKNIETLAYREGIMVGKENLSQASFDSGYSQGFKMGLALGYCNQTLSLVQDDNTLCKESQHLIINKSDDPLLKNEEKGYCLVCNEPQSEDIPPNILEENQTVTNDAIVTKIKEKYTPLFKEIGFKETEKINIFMTKECSK